MSLGTIYQSIEILSKEKGIDPKIILDAVKDAMLVAARKHFRTTEDLVAEFDEHSGAIQIFGVRRVVADVTDPEKEISLEGARAINPDAEIDSEVRFAKPTEALGRISAQTAKQVILQKVREAERENIYSEYSGRVGELVTCVIKRVEGQDLMADLGKTEARLPKKEQSKLESFSVGDRIRCVIKSVEKAGKNAGVIVSRAAPELVMRLFEQEVPEIYDNTVVIKGCAREAGERTKIAVSSRDRDVDSVGACVGMKGMRVQSIIRELRGEKIDIIEFNEDPVVFATHALSPAKISRVTILDPVDKHMEVIVDDTQLSLAIGKKGQNVRLAAKLLGWRVDIKSEEEKRQEVESQMAALVVPGAPVSVLIDHGLPEEVVEKLMASGVPTVERLGSMTPEELEEIESIDPNIVERIQLAVNSYYGQFEGSVENPAEAQKPAKPEAAPVGVGTSGVETGGVETGAVETGGVETGAVETGGAETSCAETSAGETSREEAEPENESVTIENTEHPAVE
ncbi:MAG TPA: transcription termination factor NusA [Bryobacteraceae bacterium]|nr:transcription termination factor NusA [Bryobacteraceae bacterium]